MNKRDTDLPPMGFILVQDFQNITFLELQSNINSRNVLIISRTVVEISPNIKLRKDYAKSLSCPLTLPLIVVLVPVTLAAL